MEFQCAEYYCEGVNRLHEVEPNCEEKRMEQCNPGYELINIPDGFCCGTECSKLPCNKNFFCFILFCFFPHKNQFDFLS